MEVVYTVDQFHQDSRTIAFGNHRIISSEGGYDPRFLLLDLIPHFQKRYGIEMAAQFAMRYIGIAVFLHAHRTKLGRLGVLRWPDNAGAWGWVDPTLVAFLLDGFVTPEDLHVFPSHRYEWNHRIAYKRAMPAFDVWRSERFRGQDEP
ncbi:MAG: hypothetical protein M1132_08705 [Chloroflexi bacterium]|nr:hypothetical protein [Chloroflexota bacterium]